MLYSASGLQNLKGERAATVSLEEANSLHVNVQADEKLPLEQWLDLLWCPDTPKTFSEISTSHRLNLAENPVETTILERYVLMSKVCGCSNVPSGKPT